LVAICTTHSLPITLKRSPFDYYCFVAAPFAPVTSVRARSPFKTTTDKTSSEMTSTTECVTLRVQVMLVLLIALTGQLSATNRKFDSNLNPSTITIQVPRSAQLLASNTMRTNDEENKPRNWIAGPPFGSSMIGSQAIADQSIVEPESDPQILKELFDQWLNNQNSIQKKQLYSDRA
jgi:hypothetical protein